MSLGLKKGEVFGSDFIDGHNGLWLVGLGDSVAGRMMVGQIQSYRPRPDSQVSHLSHHLNRSGALERTASDCLEEIAAF